MTVVSFQVPAIARGRRLDVVLAELDARLSRSQAAHLIREGCVQVRSADGIPTKRLKAGLALVGGETIIVEHPPPEPLSAAPEDIPLDVRYEDDDLLVINKPAGLVVHPAPGHARGTLVNALAAYCARLSSLGGPIRPGILHRLDKDTSGLLIVAKNDRTHAAFAEQIAARTLSREYLALVWGHPNPPQGRIEAAIGRDPHGGKAMKIEGRASRDAATQYETLETYPYTSWLRLALETGRTHQIRVHLRFVGHPVVGDPQYGGRDRAVRGIAPQYRRSAKALLEGLPRQALHAWRLTFVHPTTSKSMAIFAEPPEDIQTARERAAQANAPGNASLRA